MHGARARPRAFACPRSIHEIANEFTYIYPPNLLLAAFRPKNTDIWSSNTSRKGRQIPQLTRWKNTRESSAGESQNRPWNPSLRASVHSARFHHDSVASLRRIVGSLLTTQNSCGCHVRKMHVTTTLSSPCWHACIVCLALRWCGSQPMR